MTLSGMSFTKRRDNLSWVELLPFVRKSSDWQLHVNYTNVLFIYFQLYYIVARKMIKAYPVNE